MFSISKQRSNQNKRIQGKHLKCKSDELLYIIGRQRGVSGIRAKNIARNGAVFCGTIKEDALGRRKGTARTRP